MEIYDVAIIPLIVGVTELAKKLGLNDKFSAVFSAILGIVIGIVYIAPDNIQEGIMVGLMMGLSASGLYSGVKNTTEGIKGE